jgi:hypothetical protein
VSIVAPVEGALLAQVLDADYAEGHHDLTRRAFTTYHTALSKAPWARRHQDVVALVDEQGRVLASARRSRIAGAVDGRPVEICVIGASAIGSRAARLGGADDGGAQWELIEHLIDAAPAEGADVALVSSARASIPDGYQRLPLLEVELRVTESPRHGAPMTMVRGGEDRDLQAIVAQGDVRARPFRFHLNRDPDLVKFAVTKKRLLAGLAPAGARQLRFVIAEEGTTAAAYLVLSVAGRAWMIEECGDRDASGARVGAMLQALIAEYPAERRPVIRAWLPPGFVPPQVTILSSHPAGELLLVRSLNPAITLPALAAADVLYWHSDVP